MGNAQIDENRQNTAIAVDTSGNPAPLLVDPDTDRLLIDITYTTNPGATVLNGNKSDENKERLTQAVTDDANSTPTPLHIDNRNGYLFLDLVLE